MWTTVPTSPAFKPSLGKSAVNTAQSCSLIVIRPQEDRPFTNLGAIVPSSNCQTERTRGDVRPACSTLLPRDSAGQNPSRELERYHACGHVRAKPQTKYPRSAAENQMS